MRSYLIRMLEMAGLDSSLMFLLLKLCSAYMWEDLVHRAELRANSI